MFFIELQVRSVTEFNKNLCFFYVEFLKAKVSELQLAFLSLYKCVCVCVCVCVLCSAPLEPPKATLLQLVSLQKASGCWDLDATLADVFEKTEDELTNQKPAQVRNVMKYWDSDDFVQCPVTNAVDDGLYTGGVAVCGHEGSVMDRLSERWDLHSRPHSFSHCSSRDVWADFFSSLTHTLTIWVCVCVCVSVGRSEGNVLLGCQVTKETLGIWRRQCFYILICEKTKEQKLTNLLWFCYLFNVKWSHALCQKFPVTLLLCASPPLVLLVFPPSLRLYFFFAK